VPGGAFLLDLPAGTPALWGDGNDVLWPEGEGLIIAGPQGVGKTTIGGQLTLALAGVPGYETLLGYTVRPLPLGKRVTYLALDRPRQIARALRRGISEEQRVLLDQRLDFWSGPLPFDLMGDPSYLARWLSVRSSGAVIVDSIKDLVSKLSDEESGAAINAAAQECLVEGIEFVGLHHPRKAGVGNKKPNTLDDLHGSGNITRGMGSVVSLFGKAGEQMVELTHLKQPAEPVGPFFVTHDRATGRSQALDFKLPEGSSATADTTVGHRRKTIVASFLSRPDHEMAKGDFDLVALGCGDDTLTRDLGALVTEGVLVVSGSTSDKRWRFVPPLASEA
jgi:replicative DNA helicase